MVKKRTMFLCTSNYIFDFRNLVIYKDFCVVNSNAESKNFALVFGNILFSNIFRFTKYKFKTNPNVLIIHYQKQVETLYNS